MFLITIPTLLSFVICMFADAAVCVSVSWQRVVTASEMTADSLTTSCMSRAFALEGRGIWHALSLSASQQVYGPLRAKADLRVALESPQPSVPAEEAGRATLEGAWKVLTQSMADSCFHIHCLSKYQQGYPMHGIPRISTD